MPTFKQVNPDEIELLRGRARGRVSYPIIKGFLETGFYIAQVDLSDTTRKAPTMHVLLKSYVQNHDTPVKPLLRRNTLYLMRLDVDKEGNPVPNWRAIRDADIEGEVTDAGVTEIIAKPVVEKGAKAK
jgi:hypothetical protein